MYTFVLSNKCYAIWLKLNRRFIYRVITTWLYKFVNDFFDISTPFTVALALKSMEHCRFSHLDLLFSKTYANVFYLKVLRIFLTSG